MRGVDATLDLDDWRRRVALLYLTGPAETYGAGRYLTDTIKGTWGRGLVHDGGRMVLDFNYAYNPSCAYHARWACPLAPPENHLGEPVRAGELAYPDPA